MGSQSASYHGYRFPPDIISHAVRLYYRFCLSFRDAEERLAQRGVTVTYETIRQWRQRFGPVYARQLRRRMRRFTSAAHVQRFASVHGVVQNLIRIGRHLFRSRHHRVFRKRAFVEWDAATGGC